MTLSPIQRIYVAIDTPDQARAVMLARNLAGHVGGVKLGKEFFVANGPAGVRAVADVGNTWFGPAQ